MDKHMNCHYRIFLFIGWLLIITMSSCQSDLSSMLRKAMQMEHVSTDSIFFYLQQINEPEKLPLEEQGDYYLLSYKATLWKTGQPNDSLLLAAIKCYEQNGQQSKYTQARVVQSASYLYRNQPDSTLLLTDKLLKEQLLNDTLKSQLYGLRRAGYYRKQDYGKALSMADSSRRLARRACDTLAYFYASQMHLNIAEKMNNHDMYTQGYQQLIEELANSPKYHYLNYYLLENLLNNSLERKEF